MVMNLILKSILAGLVITLSLILVGVVGLYIEGGLSGDAGDVVIKLSVYLLYWPLMLIEALGIGPDCANADDIGLKLNCFGIACGSSVFAYSLLSYIILRWRKREVVLR
jgi:hypothetical protein